MSMFPFFIEGYKAERISKCSLSVSEYEYMFTFPKSSGDFISTGETDHDQFTSVQDGNPVVLTYNNFTVQAGHTVTTSNRCKGLYLNILGDLTIDGTLSMTARGASAEGRYVVVMPGDNIYFCIEDPGNISSLVTIPAVGGIGKSTLDFPEQYTTLKEQLNNKVNGENCTNGACGAGGGTYRKGGNGTSFSGGSGAGGLASNNTQSGITNTGAANKCTAGSDTGGPGGNGASGASSSYGGGGAGNPGGTGLRSNSGSSGTGGLMIIKVHGNINITGSIQSHGSSGGRGYKTAANAYPHSNGGGCSGGGAIHIFHKGTITGNELVTATGGKPLVSVRPGPNGGDGTVNIVKI